MRLASSGTVTSTAPTMAGPLIEGGTSARWSASQSRWPTVDRAILAEHLALAERHVAQGEEHLARQRKLIRGDQRRSLWGLISSYSGYPSSAL